MPSLTTSLFVAIAPAVAGFSFGQSKAAPMANPFESMPGGFGWAQTKGLAYSFGKPFSTATFPGLAAYVQEAEIKHARVAMLAATGFVTAELFHPLWGGAIDVPSYVAFQATPLQTFWPIVVGGIFLIESASALTTFADPQEALWTLKPDHSPGDIGFDPLGFAAKGDFRSQELLVGRIAMLAIATMVSQELVTHAPLFTGFETL